MTFTGLRWCFDLVQISAVNLFFFIQLILCGYAMWYKYQKLELISTNFSFIPNLPCSRLEEEFASASCNLSRKII